MKEPQIIFQQQLLFNLRKWVVNLLASLDSVSQVTKETTEPEIESLAGKNNEHNQTTPNTSDLAIPCYSFYTVKNTYISLKINPISK